MATMISEVYDALRAAQGVDEEKAPKAAEAIANYDNRLSALSNDITEMKGMQKLTQWMLAFNILLSFTTAGVVIRILLMLGEGP